MSISGSLCPAGRSFPSGWFVRRERYHGEHLYELAALWRVSHYDLRKQACWCCVDSSATSPPTGLIFVTPLRCVMGLSDGDDGRSRRARSRKLFSASLPRTPHRSPLSVGSSRAQKPAVYFGVSFAKCQKFSSNHQGNHCAPGYHLFILKFLSCIGV